MVDQTSMAQGFQPLLKHILMSNDFKIGIFVLPLLRMFANCRGRIAYSYFNIVQTMLRCAHVLLPTLDPGALENTIHYKRFMHPQYRTVVFAWVGIACTMHMLWQPQKGRKWVSIQPIAHSLSASIWCIWQRSRTHYAYPSGRDGTLYRCTLLQKSIVL